MLTVEVCTRELGAGRREAAFPEHRRALLRLVRRAVAMSRELPLEARRVLEQLRGDDQVGLGRLLQRPADPERLGTALRPDWQPRLLHGMRYSESHSLAGQPCSVTHAPDYSGHIDDRLAKRNMHVQHRRAGA